MCWSWVFLPPTDFYKHDKRDKRDNGVETFEVYTLDIATTCRRFLAGVGQDDPRADGCVLYKFRSFT